MTHSRSLIRSVAPHLLGPFRLVSTVVRMQIAYLRSDICVYNLAVMSMQLVRRGSSDSLRTPKMRVRKHTTSHYVSFRAIRSRRLLSIVLDYRGLLSAHGPYLFDGTCHANSVRHCRSFQSTLKWSLLIVRAYSSSSPSLGPSFVILHPPSSLVSLQPTFEIKKHT
jgi:hypothetical protein